jgi:hypothetical protein
LRSHALRPLWSVLPLALLASACTDNVACVFTTGCQGGGGAISDNEASLPVDGDWILDGPPAVQSVFPTGTLSPGTTPIVVVFSETMREASLVGAVEVLPLIDGSPGFPVNTTAALVGDGRVLVLLTLASDPLDPGDYLVRLTEDAVPTDLTGQPVELEGLASLGNFGVPATPPAAPDLVMTFPADGAVNQSQTPEIVAVFDRPVLPNSVTVDSFDVQVDGADPDDDPPAEPLVLQIGTTPVVETRVFRYRSTDANGRASPFATGAEVELSLSPTSAKITEQDGGVLLPVTIDFRVAAVAAPLSASLLSDPNDAIGLANLTDGNAEELEVEVELDGLETNDSIDLFLLGVQKSVEEDPPLIALQRSLRLTATAPIQSAILTREIIALQFSDAPDDVRFEDGAVTFAFRSRRGSVVTPVRILDLDDSLETIQDPLLDTTPPTVTALVGSSGTATFRSDLRGLSLAGKADGRVDVVEVTTPLGNTPPLAPVIGSDDPGNFLAAPVDLGLVAGGATTYSFVARDVARNSSPTAAGDYTQLGVLGPDAFAPGDSVTVEVFDAGTLAALPGARVIVHSDRGNGVFPLVDSDVTLVDGRIAVDTEGAPSVGAIVSVVLAGYDLFTLHGVPSTHLSVPLSRSNQALARAIGAVVTNSPSAMAVVGALDRRYDDSRRPMELRRGFVGQSCDDDQLPGNLVCSYGPEAIGELDLGARSFFAGDFDQTEAGFQSSLLLRAFALRVPLPPAPPAALQPADIEVPFLLDDPSTPAEEATQGLPAFTFRVDPVSGVDLLELTDDPATSGVPFATVETLVPGLPGSIAVAQALTYDQGGNAWTVRAAMPGAITAAGSLGSAGRVDTDPFVRVSVIDEDGNQACARPRLSAIVAGAPAPEFRALSVATQLSPAPTASTGGQAFTLLLTHAIGDDRSEGGLYRVELEDEAGRRWSLWRFDPAGTADVPLRVVDVGEAGALGLADGIIVSQVSAFAWQGLVATSFLWSDIERRFELFSQSARFSFQKP